MTTTAYNCPIDLLITDLEGLDWHTIHGQSRRGADYLARLLEFHDLQSLAAPNRAIRISRRDLDTWLHGDIQKKGLGLYTYATHPDTGTLELAQVIGQSD